MEAEHVDRVHALSPGTPVGLLHPDGMAIPDPYGGSRADYEVSYTLIREALEQRLREPAKRPGAGERKPPMLGGKEDQ
jgi:protein-tyrosine-phosphatase